MIREMVMAGMLLCGGMAFGEEIIAHWDFSGGSVSSTDGRFKGVLRGTTKLEGEPGHQVLKVGMSDKGEGLLLSRIYPELTPPGAFRIEAKVTLRSQTARQPILMIWDSNYFLDPGWKKYKDDPEAKKGLAFYISRNDEALLRPIAVLGHGNGLEVVSGAPLTVEEEVPFTISFEYDGVKEVSFFLNGEVNRKTGTKFEGALTPARYPAVIGDRVKSRFCRFDGTIAEVRLIDLRPQKGETE